MLQRADSVQLVDDVAARWRLTRELTDVRSCKDYDGGQSSA